MGRVTDIFRDTLPNAVWDVLKWLYEYILKPYAIPMAVTLAAIIWGYLEPIPRSLLFGYGLYVFAMMLIIINEIQVRRIRTKLEQGQIPVWRNTEQASISSRYILTGAQATKITDDVRLLLTTFPVLRVRIVSTQEHMGFAKQLAGALRSGGGSLVIDDRRNEDVFIAQPEHSQMVLRFRDDGPTRDSLTYYTFRTTLEAAFRDQIVIVTNLFPRESAVDYLQIEIGGGPQVS